MKVIISLNKDPQSKAKTYAHIINPKIISGIQLIANVTLTLPKDLSAAIPFIHPITNKMLSELHP